MQPAGENERGHDEIGHRHLELGDERVGRDHAERQHAHRDEADDGKHPRPGADDGRIGVGAQQPEVGLGAQQLAQFEADAGHLCQVLFVCLRIDCEGRLVQRRLAAQPGGDCADFIAQADVAGGAALQGVVVHRAVVVEHHGLGVVALDPGDACGAGGLPAGRVA